MTTTVTIPPSMSYDGSTHIYTDDSNPTTGLDGGGHVDRLAPLFKDAVSIAEYITTHISTQVNLIDTKVATTEANVVITDDNVTLSNQWATSLNLVDSINYGAKKYAIDAANYSTALQSTSITSVSLGTSGDILFITQENKQYVQGQFVTISHDMFNYMYGQVVSYVGTNLTVNVTVPIGSGTYSNWTIGISGVRGITGAGANINIGNPTNVTGLFVGNGSEIHQAVSGVDFKELNGQSILGSGELIVGVPDFILFQQGII